ncbi:MAG: ATP-grasp domain-containing protein [Chloroflexi bacterium]|nr:MAG: ATP-grasp domain-containing protein [Chloroflexota bacterium]
MTTLQKKPAFLLMAKAAPLTSHPQFLLGLRARGLAPLLVTESLPPGVDASAEASAKELARHSSALEGIQEVAVFTGSQQLAIQHRVATWANDYDIRGTLCLGEIFVEGMGMAADMLGLPHPGLRATKVCRNKLLQRLYLRDWSPRCQVIAPAHRASFVADFSDGPAILKPTGRFASSGVQEIADASELAERLTEYEADEVLLLEQKVVGREVSVESLIQDGKVVFIGITEKATNESDGRFFVEMGHTFPCGNLSSQEMTAIRATNARVLDRLSFENGIAHAEYRVTADGGVYLMEVACRAPGDGLLALYQLATLRSLEVELVKLALGDPVTYPEPVRRARQVYMRHAPGRLIDVQVARAVDVTPHWVPDQGRWPAIEVGSAGDPARVRHLMVLKPRGTQLSEVRDSFDRVVTFLIDGRTTDELDRLEQHVRDSVSIVTSSA